MNTKPLVLPLLVLLNVAVYVLNVIQAGDLRNNELSESFDLGVLWPPAVAAGEWWRLITAGFLHYGPIHLLMNMVSLWLLGRDLEIVFGRVRFLLLYLLSLLGGSAVVFMFGEMQSGTAGASGAVYGVMGALAVTIIRLKRPVGQILGIIALNIAISFTIPNISWLGHLGGLAVGVLFAAGMLYPRPEKRKVVQIATVAGIVVLLAVLIGIRYSQFTHAECVHQNGRTQCMWFQNT
jgi:membrane associated rhomboid family serine protease